MGKETASEEAPVRAPEKPKPVKKVLDKNNHMMRGILDIQKDREGVKSRNQQTCMDESNPAGTVAFH